jgi:hypothetical protein
MNREGYERKVSSALSFQYLSRGTEKTNQSHQLWQLAKHRTLRCPEYQKRSFNQLHVMFSGVRGIHPETAAVLIRAFQFLHYALRMS